MCLGVSFFFLTLKVVFTFFESENPQRDSGFELSFSTVLNAIVLAPLLESLVFLLFVFLTHGLLVRKLRIARMKALSLILLEMFVVGAVTHSANWYGIPAGIVFCILALPIFGGVESEEYREGMLRSLLAHMIHNAVLIVVHAAALQAVSKGS
jgi:hypothetical protein